MDVGTKYEQQKTDDQPEPATVTPVSDRGQYTLGNTVDGNNVAHCMLRFFPSGALSETVARVRHTFRNCTDRPAMPMMSF